MCNMCACVEYVSYIYMMYFAHKISRAYLSVECVVLRLAVKKFAHLAEMKKNQI